MYLLSYAGGPPSPPSVKEPGLQAYLRLLAMAVGNCCDGRYPALHLVQEAHVHVYPSQPGPLNVEMQVGPDSGSEKPITTSLRFDDGDGDKIACFTSILGVDLLPATIQADDAIVLELRSDGIVAPYFHNRASARANTSAPDRFGVLRITAASARKGMCTWLQIRHACPSNAGT